MGPALPYFGAVGCRRQDVKDNLQGGGSGGDPVWILVVGYEPVHQKDARGISPSGGPPVDEKKTRRDVDGTWRYPPLSTEMAEIELEEVNTYVARRQKMVAQYITIHTIMYLFLEVEWRHGERVSKIWWEKGSLDLVISWAEVAREVGVVGEEDGSETTRGMIH